MKQIMFLVTSTSKLKDFRSLFLLLLFCDLHPLPILLKYTLAYLGQQQK